MSAQESFQTLRTFFETRQASRQALMLLPAGFEIGITIGGQVECALFSENGAPKVENRAAQDPIFNVSMRPETVEVISGSSKDELPEMAMNVLKEVLAGDIKFDISLTLVPKMFNIIRQMRNDFRKSV